MRDMTFVVIMALGILALCLCLARGLMDTQAAHAQLRNAYWPFTVEMQIRDK